MHNQVFHTVTEYGKTFTSMLRKKKESVFFQTVDNMAIEKNQLSLK